MHPQIAPVPCQRPTPAGVTAEEVLEQMPAPCDGLAPIVRFIFQPGSKLLRSRLLFLAAGTVNKPVSHLPEAAALLELLHNGTLLHDDVMDQAMIRRHRPTVNRLWGDTMAILAGDFMLTAVMDLALRIEHPAVPRLCVSTLRQLISGQTHEVLNQGNLALSEEDYLRITRGKTGALFAAACRMGGILAREKEETLFSLETYGLELGTAFQLVDDLLDYASPPCITGKEPGRDLAQAKVTLPLIAALRKATPREKDRIIVIFSDNHREQHLQELTALLRDLGGLLYTLTKAQQCAKKAIVALSAFPAGEAKDQLEQLAREVAHIVFRP